MKYALLVSTSLLAAALAAPSMAAPSQALAAAAVAPVDELVVTAVRTPERADRIGQQVTVVDAQELRAQQTPVVSDILSRTPGISFTRNGGVGTSTQIYIRGAETGQTMVLIDGVRLNDPTAPDNSFNFGNLLIGDIDRVEILRGPQSVLWGSQAIGGVINLITANPQKPFESDLTAEGGSHGWGAGRAAVGGKTDRVDWRLAASYLSTTGISTFDEAKGGREADGYRNEGATAKVRITATDQLSFDLRAIYSRGRTDLDGFPPPNYTFADTPEYSFDEDVAAYAGANLDLLGGRLHNRFAVTATHTSHKNFDPTTPPTEVTFSGFGHTERYEYQGVYDITQTWAAVFGLEREDAHMRSASFGGPYNILGSTLDSIYAQAHGDVIEGLTLSGGLRHDHHDTFGGHTTGQVAAAWRLNDGRTILRASWGQGFKAPTLYQLGSEYGNLALKPEEATGWDMGVEQRFLGDKAMVSAAFFERHTQNQIDFVSCFGGPAPLCPSHPAGGYYDNIARTKARGVELQANADLTDALSVNANYTWTEARNDAEGTANFDKRLPRRPTYEANAEASYLWPVKLTTALAAHYAGDRYDDAANRNLVKGYVLWDIRASYPLTELLEVYGRVENLFDKHYETIRNYGQLGRAVYGGLRARF
jgi:vitamin B12 transporter